MGILTDNLTDERLEAMVAGYPKANDITEAMMQRITHLELIVLELEGMLAQLEFKVRNNIV